MFFVGWLVLFVYDPLHIERYITIYDDGIGTFPLQLKHKYIFISKFLVRCKQGKVGLSRPTLCNMWPVFSAAYRQRRLTLHSRGSEREGRSPERNRHAPVAHDLRAVEHFASRGRMSMHSHPWGGRPVKGFDRGPNRFRKNSICIYKHTHSW